MAVSACKDRFRASRLRADSFVNASAERVQTLVVPVDDLLIRAPCRFPLLGFAIGVPLSDASLARGFE